MYLISFDAITCIEKTMKNLKKLKLPAIGDGTLIAEQPRHENNDFYNSFSIEHESSDSSSSNEDSGTEDSTSPVPPSGYPLPRRRSTTFRAIANAVLAQKCWAKEVMKKWENELTEVCSVKDSKEDNTMTFNPKAFKAHIQACGNITPELKMILRKYSRRRTAEEVELVSKLVRRLRCFDRYSPMVRQELGRILYYDSFEDGRLITRQGQSGISFYFIVSGVVVVERIEIDKQTGSKHIQRIDELGPGYSFGELALLHNNTKRAASMICKGHCEFLRIDRGEFEDVLQMIREKEWKMRADILSELQVFADYSTRDLMILNSSAKSETFRPNTLILGGIKQRPDRVYIITSGTCYVVFELIVMKRQITKRKFKYILPSQEMILHIKQNNGRTNNEHDIVEKHNLIIKQLVKGDVFNLGECLRGLLYVSSRTVEVIHIAKMSFTRQVESLKAYEKMIEDYQRSIPSREDVFKNFVAESNWRSYKTNMVQQVVSRSRRSRRNESIKLPSLPAVKYEPNII